jgi:hypothetical protein
MIARCNSCGQSYLEIDSRRIADPSPLCVNCALDDIERTESKRIAVAASALCSIAAVPSRWIGGNRGRAR